MSNTRHKIFVDAQRELNVPVLELERTVPTRWFYWYSSINKVHSRLEAIFVVLETFITLHRDAKTEAENLRRAIRKPSFRFLLTAMKDILGTTNSLSLELQAQTLTLLNTIKLISSTNALIVGKRSEQSFKDLFKESHDFAGTHNLIFDDTSKTSSIADHSPPQARSSKVIKISKKLSGTVVCSSLGQRSTPIISPKNCLKKLYFEIIDRLINEFENRFLQNQDILSGLGCFNLETEHFLSKSRLQSLVDNFKDFFNEPLLCDQLKVAKHVLMTEKKNCVMTMLQHLETMPVAFSEAIKLFKICLTLPVTTVSNEIFFCAVNSKKLFAYNDGRRPFIQFDVVGRSRNGQEN